MFDLALDIRYAFRRLASRPASTVLMLLTLALAIGVSTAVFTVVDETLFRRAPFAFADRLVDVLDLNRATGGGGSSLTTEKIAGWQRSPLFEKFEGYAPRQFDIGGGGEPERVSALFVTTGLLPMLGVQPELGRGFAPDEGRPGSPRVVLIDHGLWRRRFGGSPDALGRTLALGEDQYTIIGVMPRRFRLLGDNGRGEVLWLPVDVVHPGTQALGFYGLARLARGVSIDSAQSRANTLADQYQKTQPLARSWDLLIEAKRVSVVRATTKTILLVLLGAVAFVLSIACANVANLFLAGAAAREREVAVRSALGAGRGRLVREVLCESVMVSLAGGAAGVLVAIWGVSAALTMAPSNIATRSTTTIEIDLRVLATAFLSTLAAGVLVGLLPALRGSRPRLDQALRAGGQHLSGQRSFATSGALIVVEVGLALVLLIGAGLMMRTFTNLHTIDPGFEPRGLVAARLSLPPNRYSSEAARFAFEDELARKLGALPAAFEPAVSRFAAPPGVGAFTIGVEAESGTPGSASTEPFAQNVVTPNYFRTLRIPVRSGRVFSEQDSEDVAVVSQAAADQLWPAGGAIGRRLRLNNREPWVTVIGIVGNVEMRVGDRPLPRQVYTRLAPPNTSSAATAPPWRAQYRSFVFLIRSAEVKATAAALKAQVWSIDRNLPIDQPSVVEDDWNDVFAQQRFALQLMSAFAFISLLLAAAGIFAVLSQLVGQRTREIGVRVALGATPRDVFLLIVSRGMIMTLGGVALGLAGAALLSRVLTTLLFGVGPYDPASFAGMSVLLVAVAFLACWLPTHRAMRVEPAVALRVE